MTDVLSLTGDIVSAHVRKNAVDPEQLPTLIRSVYDALTKATQPEPEPQAKEPAVPVRKSVFNDHVVCLECGGSYRILKRHLEREHGLTTDEYRARFNLSHDYPLIAPEYAEARRAIAKEIGLGRNQRGKRVGRKSR